MDTDKASSAADIKTVLKIFRHTNGDELDERELLLLILCFACPIKQAEALVEALFEAYGSYSEIFRASHTQLERVPGITQKAVALIVILGKLHRDSMCYTAATGKYIEDIGQMFAKIMDGSPNEQIWAAGFDECGILMACECVQLGRVDSVAACISAIADFASRNRVDRIAVAHNHPTLSKLSQNGADINVSAIIANTLLEFGIVLERFFLIDDGVDIIECDLLGESG